MRRIGWIWGFSFLQLPFFVLLIWYGCPYRPTWVGWLGTAPGQERGFEINLEEIDMLYLPLPEQIAVGLNAPPALIVELMNMSIYHATRIYFTGAERELISHAVTALIIPFFWIWIIRTTTARGRTRLRLSIFLKVTIQIGIVLLSILAILTLGQILVISDHYGIVRNIFFLTWFLWGIGILTLKLRKMQASQPASDSTNSSRDKVIGNYGECTMKMFFIIMLVLSVVMGLHSGLTYVSGYAHNHYEDRYFALHNDRFAELSSDSWWVATPKHLSECPVKVAGAYKESVEDAYLSSIVSRDLLHLCFLLAAMLFACSVIGILAARKVRLCVNAINGT